MFRLGRREKALFCTHRPAFQAREWAVGQLVEHQGCLYRVTRWEELPLVSLSRGGSVRQWRVWGRRLSRREMRQVVVKAAERALDS